MVHGDQNQQKANRIIKKAGGEHFEQKITSNEQKNNPQRSKNNLRRIQT
jgi:hypothetical protein